MTCDPQLRTVSLGPFLFAWWWPRGFFFRVFGWGLNVHRRSTHKVMFGERYGYYRWFYVGPICWRVLRPRSQRRPLQMTMDGIERHQRKHGVIPVTNEQEKP